MKPIPVLGIPIVNGFRWIKRLIESIDYPITNVVIINNSGGDKDLEKQLDDLVNQGSPYVLNMKVCHLPGNLGVAGAWNLIIKTYMMEPYWVISNHDVAFQPGLLKELAETASNPGIGMIHPHAGEFDLGSYDLFMIRDWVIQEIGLFDENLYPAYGEDADYMMRLHNHPIWSIKGLSKVHLHGEAEAEASKEHYEEHGQQTKKDNPELGEKLTRINETNFGYLNDKWGEGWRQVSPHPHPMNNPTLDKRYTTFDLWFARTKNLGF